MKNRTKSKATPLAVQVCGLFHVAQEEAPYIQVVLKSIPPEDGGWSEEKWNNRDGGTLLVMDAEGRVVRAEMLLNPSPEWQVDTENYAKTKCEAILADKQKRPSVELIDDEAGVWAGGIPFQYACPHEGTIKTGSIAFSGWPQFADHLSVSLWASGANLTVDYAAMVTACPDSPLKKEFLDECV